MRIEFPFVEDDILELHCKNELSNKDVFYKIKKHTSKYMLEIVEDKFDIIYVTPTKSSASIIDVYCDIENLCIIEECRKDSDGGYLLKLSVKRFVDKILNYEDISISYNRQIFETASRVLGINIDDERVFINKIKEELSYKYKDKTLLYYISGRNKDGDQTITFIGKAINVTVEEKNNVFGISRIFRNTKNNIPIGYIRVNDFLISNYADGQVNKHLLEDIKGDGTYIEDWKYYLHLQVKELLGKPRDSFTKIESDENGKYALSITSKDQFSIFEGNKGGDFIIVDKIPDDIVELFEDEEEDDDDEFIIFNKLEPLWMNWVRENNKRIKKCELTGVNGKEGKVIVKSKDDLNSISKGQLTFDFTGDLIQFKRQMKALEDLSTGRSRIPHLISLIEKKETTGLIPGTLKLSSFASKKVFGEKGPNESQLDAVLRALNTPDIVLIQGPPGTGKTTVARAIAERKNEILDSKRMNVLFSAYQHDAVKNILERTEINGFPVVKVGKKRGENEWETTIAKWISNIKEGIRVYCEKNPVDSKYTEAILYMKGYIRNPLPYEKLPSFLKRLNKLFPFKNTDLLINELISAGGVDISNVDEKRIYALRTSKQGFEDDGLLQLHLLHQSPFLTDEDKEKVSKVIDIAENKGAADEVLNDIKSLKTVLLDKYKKDKSLNNNLPNQKIIDLFRKLGAEINRRKMSYKPADVIHELLGEFNSDPFAIEDAVLDYAAGVGSTTGQAVGNDNIDRLKLTENSKNGYTFNTVIIDEAARATPLDLFGVMNIAEGQIVLIGDHRQLPHMIDEDIMDKINDESGDTESYLDKSFFEYMFNLLKEREKNDGIKRVITLNKQYRMHRLLGNFVSDTFYKSRNEEEAFESPRDDEEFRKYERFENKPLGWIDVPFSDKNKEKKNNNQSWQREIEADIIVEELKIILSSEKSVADDEKSTIGVISFYRGQVQLLEKKLKRSGISVENLERVKVGTVDSFQGLEFDAVFLSMVRSNKRKEFGFLKIENRLCVAMSRQKSLLVMVGDREMVDSCGEYNHPAEGLYKFSQLCRAKGCNKKIQEKV